MSTLTEIGGALAYIQETREELGALHSFIASAGHEPHSCLLDGFLSECRRRIFCIASRERCTDVSLSSLDALISEIATKYLASEKARVNGTVGDLTAPDVARLLPLIYLSARSVEQALERKLSRLEKQVEDTLGKYKLSSGASKDQLLGEELKRFLTTSSQIPTTSLILPYQSFASRAASDMLCTVIEKSPRLVVVDFSFCLLGDQGVLALLNPLSALQHLSCLILKKNDLTAAITPIFLQSLQRDGPSCAFPMLRGLSLEGNDDLPREDIAAIQGAIRQAQQRRLPKPRSALPAQRTLVFDAPCMRALAIAQCLHLSSSTDEMMALASSYDVFCGSSYAAVIAVAVAMKLPTDLIVAFFRSVARTVFANTPYLSLANHAGRVVRDWWSAGNFYSAVAFRNSLAELFTESSLKVPFSSLSALIGKRILLFASTLPSTSTDPQPVCFPSWEEPSLVSSTSQAAPTLEQVLMACCSTSTFFAPVSISSASRSGAVNTCCDMLYTPISALVAELLPSLDLDGEPQITVFTTSTAGDDRSFLASGNPLVSLALAACISSVAEKRGKHGTPPNSLVVSLRQKVEFANAERLNGVGVHLAVKSVLLPGKTCDDVALDEGDDRLLSVALQNKVRKIDFSSL